MEEYAVKKFRTLRSILRQTLADRVLLSFLAFILFCALAIWILEPGITHFSDALWYCYAVITTVGFGDVYVTRFASKMLSVLLSIYSVISIAILTGVVVNFFTELVALRRKESLASIIDKLEHLPDLTREELDEISEHIRNLRLK